MKLSERKKKILQYVVDDYISTAQPVSSKSITEKYMPGISSATVRSELAGLEEMGYLNQLHTSSGRVPSIDAYRLYVTELMDKSKLTREETGLIRAAFTSHVDSMETVVNNAVKVISELTNYTSVAVSSHSGKEKIVKIEIFRFKPNQALLLVVTENTLIRDKFIEIPESMTDAEIADAGRIIFKALEGKALDEVLAVGKAVCEEFADYREIFDGVMDAIEEYVERDKADVVIKGEDKILDHSEAGDGEKMRNFLSVVTSKDKLCELLDGGNEDIEINIKIGGESEDVPKDCSIVSATYSASGVKVGTYGVIGPLRMDYQKVVSVLKGVGKVLEDILENKK